MYYLRVKFFFDFEIAGKAHYNIVRRPSFFPSGKNSIRLIVKQSFQLNDLFA
jgi:hypothetical protein